jgi:methylaspartate mutase sigma subunit
MYLGGYLLIGEMQWEEVEKRFKEAGFNRVYQPGITPAKVIADLDSDISSGRR